MTLEQIEAEVLALPKDAQLVILARLLEQLGQDNEMDKEITNSWVEEAEKRDEEMGNNEIIGTPAEEVFQRIRASLP